MTSETNDRAFVQRVRELLISLPYDMKVFFEAISDENLPLETRKASAGAIIYCLAPSDPIPDTVGVQGFVDDVVVCLLTLERLLALGGEDAAEYPARFPDQFEHLEQDLALIRAYLGENMAWLERRVEKKQTEVRYKGKPPEVYVTDDEAQEYLYSEGLAFTTDYEIDEKGAAKLTTGESVLKVFRHRKEVEDKRIPG